MAAPWEGEFPRYVWVLQVITRLDESGIDDTPLQTEWTRLTSMDAEEAAFCEFAARLGLDPLSEGVDMAESIEHTFQSFDPALRAEFCDAVNPDGILDAVRWVQDSLEGARHHKATHEAAFRPEQLGHARPAIRNAEAGAPPWVLGYEAARQLRHDLGLETTDVMVELPVATHLRRDGVREVAGAGAVPDGDGVVNLVLARSMREEAQRFAMSRALWHASEPDGGNGYLLTSARSTSQRVGRAFAAELLAPAAGIEALLDVDPRVVTPEEIVAVADHYGTSDMLIEHQVRNQLLTT